MRVQGLLTLIRCCQGGTRDGAICLGCALHGEPNICEYPLVLIDEVVNGQARRGDTGDFSATGLQRCPRQVRLISGGGDDDPGVVPDDRYALFRGTMYHRGVEAAITGTPGTTTERRLYKDVVVDGQTHRLSGQFDLRLNEYRGGTILEDYKSTAKTNDNVGQPDMDYVRQAGIYAWLHDGGVDGDGNPVHVEITGYRVWYFTNDGIKGFWVDLPELQETEDYIVSRIRLLTQEDLPEILPMRTYRDRQRREQRQVDRHCLWCPISSACFAMEGMKIVGMRAVPLDEEVPAPSPDPRLEDWING